jgi:hypothetical protein
MRGEAGKELRFRNPSTLGEALNVAMHIGYWWESQKERDQ